MKKIGLIALALVLSLGLMGAGLAYWNETLTIDGSVATGELNVEFSEAYSNDPANDDPNEAGSWVCPPAGPESWTGTRELGFDVASTTVTGAGSESQELIVTMDNLYPCYWGSVKFVIHNTGTIPAKIKSIKIDDTAVSKPCDSVLIDLDDPSKGQDGKYDICVHLTEMSVGDVIGPPCPSGFICGDIDIHCVEESVEGLGYDATPGVSGSFTVVIEVTQFNA